MAERTPIKSKRISDPKNPTKPLFSPSSTILSPQTPNTRTPSRLPVTNHLTTPRRSSRRLSLNNTTDILCTPEKPTNFLPQKTLEKTPKCAKSIKSSNMEKTQIEENSTHELFCPESPALSERKRKRGRERTNVVESQGRTRGRGRKGVKKRVYYKKAVYDGGEFGVGDDVYVKRREDASSDGEDPEVEECRVCFRVKGLMIECDDCLGGFHLKCNKPPLKEVPEGDWICGFCEAKKSGKEIVLPLPPKGKRRARTLKEKLLSSDLWAARIERYTFLSDRV